MEQSRNKMKNSKLKKDLLILKKDFKEVLNIKTLDFKSLNLNYILITLLIVAAFLLGFLVSQFKDINLPQILPQAKAPAQQNAAQPQNVNQPDLAKIQSKVIKSGYTFKIKWGDLGQKMVQDGVIDKQKLAKAVTGTDNLPPELDKYLSGSQDKIELSQKNAQFWVDVLWGLGLANKNKILDTGSMVEGGNTANFASTGGYTIGVKQPMDIYSKSSYINLSENQQAMVEEIAGSIYRPCCGNSTAFPDCNHGMAMLGLIELMVSQGFSKDEIYKTALAFNTYWFPQTYLDTAYYFQQNGRDYNKISAQELLSKTFSSAMGYQVIQKKVGTLQWPALKGGGSCGA
ncbi:MAG: hypothetical protein M1405_03535 [Patescibacteria group bacterium]|nr:hypothetical protein [Patescibacteria group bacterium]